MADTAKPLLIKRYASRRLYNTETSDYVTLEDIAGFIRAGREVQIVDCLLYTSPRRTPRRKTAALPIRCGKPTLHSIT